MTAAEVRKWEGALRDACFPVTLADVHVGNPPRCAKRYRAVVPVDAGIGGDPFAVVTDRYRLIRNEDVIDLGHEAFGRLFGSHHGVRITVFNVVMAKGAGAASSPISPLRCSIATSRFPASTVLSSRNVTRLATLSSSAPSTATTEPRP